jgi:hypothetical protein
MFFSVIQKIITSQKGFVPVMQLLLIFIVMVGLILTVGMIRQPQVLSPKAAESMEEIPFFGVSLGQSEHTVIPASHTQTITLNNPAHTPVPAHAQNQQQCISQLTCHYHPDWCQDQLKQGQTVCHSQNNNQVNANHPNNPVHSIYHGYCNVIGAAGIHCNN